MAASEKPVGLLLMAYGTPAHPDDLEAYYTHIRRGRAPSNEQLADLRRRYEAIGGMSPLLGRTRAQVRGVQAALDRTAPGRFTTVLGMKHAPPFVEDAVAELLDARVERIVGLVLAPHYSALSVGEYIDRAGAAAGEAARCTPVRSWHMAPGLLDLLANRVTAALSQLPPGSEVVFTAHSLPVRVTEHDDPYPEQVRETAAAVAHRVGLPGWSQAWQSAGRTPDPWLGPDICEVVRDRASAGVPGVLVCPAGFVADHLEVLYDLDVEAAGVAADAGIAFARTQSLNDDPAFCATVAAVALEHLK